jgi:hypothetical protein
MFIGPAAVVNRQGHAMLGARGNIWGGETLEERWTIDDRQG